MLCYHYGVNLHLLCLIAICGNTVLTDDRIFWSCSLLSGDTSSDLRYIIVWSIALNTDCKLLQSTIHWQKGTGASDTICRIMQNSDILFYQTHVVRDCPGRICC